MVSPSFRSECLKNSLTGFSSPHLRHCLVCSAVSVVIVKRTTEKAGQALRFFEILPERRGVKMQENDACFGDLLRM
jgi:hypothetical protein